MEREIKITKDMVDAGVARIGDFSMGAPMAEVVEAVYLAMALEYEADTKKRMWVSKQSALHLTGYSIRIERHPEHRFVLMEEGMRTSVYGTLDGAMADGEKWANEIDAFKST